MSVVRSLLDFENVRRINETRERIIYHNPLKINFARKIPNKKFVLISESTNVFINLALEYWLYHNINFSKHVLFIWNNDPCIVFGRHQNPWHECNVHEAKKNGINLVRRCNGDDTVYHDEGSLNLTFFTPKEKYDPKYNLDIIRNTLIRHWGLRSEIDESGNIMIDGNTILSGTASKLGKSKAYYHCSLSINVNKTNENFFLKNKKNGVVMNAMTSTHSTKNLSDINPDIQIDHFVSALGWKYMNTKAYENEKCDFIHQQKSINYIIPTEAEFPGINRFIRKVILGLVEWQF